ncbi:MAG TPA: 30S ribosomal protein S16 [Candidatus Omnitrophota bacterium]|nr:30S ribosomal protein S16 [Candidatus Omnitrophota bacterium]HQL41000.1 30S ribosomal protein S16 [Candidatus Omnitrophota bacterium]
MEVCIRLQRIGKSINKVSNYRIVAIPKSRKRDGKVLEIIGHYDPSKKPAALAVNTEKLDKWVAQGAVMSDTVRTLSKKLRKK